MSRLARIVVPGVSHHVTQRGNNLQGVFFAEDDRRAYLDLLQEQGERFGFRLEGYCLMTNHVHLIGVPEREESLSKAIGRTHFLYSRHVNKMHGRSGHLWQNRFHSCAMDENHRLRAICYAELNPVRGGIVKRAWDYPWSSAAAHCGADDENPYVDMPAWREAMSPKDWKATLKEVAHNKGAQDTVRGSTRSGRPLGSDSFLNKIETATGRRVRPLPVGRQKGWRKK